MIPRDSTSVGGRVVRTWAPQSPQDMVLFRPGGPNHSLVHGLGAFFFFPPVLFLPFCFFFFLFFRFVCLVSSPGPKFWGSPERTVEFFCGFGGPMLIQPAQIDRENRRTPSTKARHGLAPSCRSLPHNSGVARISIWLWLKNRHQNWLPDR